MGYAYENCSFEKVMSILTNTKVCVLYKNILWY